MIISSEDIIQKIDQTATTNYSNRQNLASITQTKTKLKERKSLKLAATLIPSMSIIFVVLRISNIVTINGTQKKTLVNSCMDLKISRAEIVGIICCKLWRLIN